MGKSLKKEAGRRQCKKGSCEEATKKFLGIQKLMYDDGKGKSHYGINFSKGREEKRFGRMARLGKYLVAKTTVRKIG